MSDHNVIFVYTAITLSQTKSATGIYARTSKGNATSGTMFAVRGTTVTETQINRTCCKCTVVAI